MTVYAKVLVVGAIVALQFGNASVRGDDLATARQAKLQPVSDLSNHELLMGLADSDPAMSGIDREEGVTELVRRRAVRDLFDSFSHPADDGQQWWVAQALREIGGADVAHRMKTYASTKTTLTTYLALYHLANEGDRAALAMLNRNYFKYPVSSLQWAEAVRLFGAHRFKGAAQNLVTSLHAASFNLVEAAEQSLGEIFPDDKREFDSLEEMQRYWAEVVARNGKADAAR